MVVAYWMPRGTVEIIGREYIGTLTINGTRRPEIGGMKMRAQEDGSNEIGMVFLAEFGGVHQRGRATGVSKTGKVFLQMLGAVLRPGAARPYFAS